MKPTPPAYVTKEHWLEIARAFRKKPKDRTIVEKYMAYAGLCHAIVMFAPDYQWQLRDWIKSIGKHFTKNTKSMFWYPVQTRKSDLRRAEIATRIASWYD